MFVVVSAVIDAPVEKVWPVLDDFAQWHTWIPLVQSITIEDGLDQGPVGCVRVLGLRGGKLIRERLCAKDEDARQLTYAFLTEPRALRRTVRLQPVTTTGDTYIEWSGEVDDSGGEDAVARFRSVYGQFLDDVATAVAT